MHWHLAAASWIPVSMVVISKRRIAVIATAINDAVITQVLARPVGRLDDLTPVSKKRDGDCVHCEICAGGDLCRRSDRAQARWPVVRNPRALGDPAYGAARNRPENDRGDGLPE